MADISENATRSAMLPPCKDERHRLCVMDEPKGGILKQLGGGRWIQCGACRWWVFSPFQPEESPSVLFTLITPPELKNDPEQKLRCKCGHEFWVDAIDGDNLYSDGKQLLAVCPSCGLRDTGLSKLVAKEIQNGAAPGIATNQTIRELMEKESREKANG